MIILNRRYSANSASFALVMPQSPRPKAPLLYSSENRSPRPRTEELRKIAKAYEEMADDLKAKLASPDESFVDEPTHQLMIKKLTKKRELNNFPMCPVRARETSKVSKTFEVWLLWAQTRQERLQKFPKLLKSGYFGLKHGKRDFKSFQNF